MVILYPNVGRAGVGPTEYQAPLVVDTDGMVAGEIAGERFEAIAGRHGKITEAFGAVHLDEFSERNPSDGLEATVFLFVEELFGVSIDERLDHRYGM